MPTKDIAKIIDKVAVFPVLFGYTTYDDDDPHFEKTKAKIRSWYGTLGHRDIQVEIKQLKEEYYRIVAYPPDMHDELEGIL